MKTKKLKLLCAFALLIAVAVIAVQSQKSYGSNLNSSIESIQNAQPKTNNVENFNSELNKSDFSWPANKKMAISLTFDDARITQVDKGIPLFDKYDVKGTFYVSKGNMMERKNKWIEAVNNGHDIGNHTVSHPCSGNFLWTRQSALEDHTLQSMNEELDAANAFIEEHLGITPVSFAYPCGGTFVGRGVNTKSYVPLVASKFQTGRGWLDEGPNDPIYCDLAQLTGMELDGKSFEELLPLIEYAKKEGSWLILVGHEINDTPADQTSLLSTIEAVCQYAADPANEVWIDNVHNIASYVNKQRGEKEFTELPLYKNPLYSIDQRVEDLLSRMTLDEKLGQINMPAIFLGQMGKSFEEKLDGARKFTEGKFIDNIGPGGGFFAASIILREGPRQQATFFNELQKIAVEKTRLQIPLLFIEEGVHGLMATGATIFPEGPALGSTWNMDLIRRVYSTAAKESRATGVNGLCTLVIEPIRDPRLGRNMEAYSEDSYMTAQIAGEIVKGMQGEDISRLAGQDKVVTYLTHFPGQSEPFGGFERGAMNISERTLREVYLPPWIEGITNSGALGVMATYVAVDGEVTHGSEWLLKNILREELGFEGIVLEEGGGFETLNYERIVPTMKEAGELSMNAGVDVGIWVAEAYLNAMHDNINEGKVSIETIDRSVRRILKIKFLLGLFENPYADVERAVRESNTKENRELALQAGREGIVLLKNENDLLPLDRDIKSIAVIGPNADDELNQLGDYTALPFLQDIVTVLDGVKNKVSSNTNVTYVKGCKVIEDDLNEFSQAQEAAKNADLAIVVLGENSAVTGGGSQDRVPTVGEGFDVASLDLTGLQEDLLKAVYDTGTPTVLVLINGRPLSIRWAAENIPAIVEAWIPGEEGGNAVADILFGDYNPDGRLSITIPRHSGQLPSYYNYPPSKRFWIKETWSQGYADMPGTPLWEFGFGLSYTSFEYSNLVISPEEIGPQGEVLVSVDVKNVGKREGKEVVQLYINDLFSSVTTPVKELKGFEKVYLMPGETKKVTFKLLPKHLTLLDKNLNSVVEPGTFEVQIGSSSEDIRLEGTFEVI